jgi:tetratricopeptide (TPR) repeat protein
LVERKELQPGFEHVRKATRLDPENGMAWFRLGQIYEVFDNKKAAARAYRRAVELLPDNGIAQQKAQQLSTVLDPELPPALARSWTELLRQMAGPTMICILAALLDSGMRPWWMPWTGWMALMLGTLGAWLWASGVSLPANPAMALAMGHQKGLQSSAARVSAAMFGGFFWLLALTIILYPIGQSSPEVPEWILSLSTF